MTESDVADLHELQAELAAVEREPWEPRCVARAFRTAQDPFVFTMQAWIDLDAAASPFLLGRLPGNEVEDMDGVLAAYAAAFRAFGHHDTTPENCDAEDLVALGRRMIREIARGFAMRVKLEPPPGKELSTTHNGLGEWLTIVAFLKSQMGFSMAEARALPVAQAFALIVAARCYEGWSVTSETYADQDVPDSDEAEDSAGGPRDE